MEVQHEHLIGTMWKTAVSNFPISNQQPLCIFNGPNIIPQDFAKDSKIAAKAESEAWMAETWHC